MALDLMYILYVLVHQINCVSVSHRAHGNFDQPSPLADKHCSEI